jgi:hypothetical protein
MPLRVWRALERTLQSAATYGLYRTGYDLGKSGAGLLEPATGSRPSARLARQQPQDLPGPFGGHRLVVLELHRERAPPLRF